MTKEKYKQRSTTGGRRLHTIVSTVKTKVATYKLEFIPCYKKSCKKCPHGPYWYAYKRVKTGQKNRYGRPTFKTIRTYLGKRFRTLKEDPGEIKNLHGDLII